MIGIINGHMLGTPSTPGEHVSWNIPDYFAEAEVNLFLGTDAADYAAANPHMILWEVTP